MHTLVKLHRRASSSWRYYINPEIDADNSFEITGYFKEGLSSDAYIFAKRLYYNGDRYRITIANADVYLYEECELKDAEVMSMYTGKMHGYHITEIVRVVDAEKPILEMRGKSKLWRNTIICQDCFEHTEPYTYHFERDCHDGTYSPLSIRNQNTLFTPIKCEEVPWAKPRYYKLAKKWSVFQPNFQNEVGYDSKTQETYMY